MDIDEYLDMINEVEKTNKIELMRPIFIKRVIKCGNADF